MSDNEEVARILPDPIQTWSEYLKLHIHHIFGFAFAVSASSYINRVPSSGIYNRLIGIEEKTKPKLKSNYKNLSKFEID